MGYINSKIGCESISFAFDEGTERYMTENSINIRNSRLWYL